MADPEGWKFELDSFIWLPSVSGSVSAFHRTVDVDASIWDILSKSKFPIALMGHAEAMNDRFGLFIEPMYMELRFTPSRNRVSADVTNQMFFLEFGGFFRALQGGSVPGDRWSVDVIAGGRYTDFNNSTSLTVSGPVQTFHRSNSNGMGWVDPMLGLRASFDIAPDWTAMLRADIGGFGIGSDFSWQAYGLVGYRFDMWGRPAIAFGGYRALSQDYKPGGPDNFRWNNTLHGPVLGLSVSF